MKSIMKYPVIIIFALFIFVLFAADIIKPDKSFTDLENRELQQRPDFSWNSLWENKYTLKYEEYINDQFIWRNEWISIKSIGENSIGKIENNGIVYGDDNYMFEKYTTIEPQRYEKNIGFLKEFFDMYPSEQITLTVIPNSYTVLADKVPLGLPNINQAAEIEKIYQQFPHENVEKIDLLPSLTKHKDEYIYYRTDHHWTTDGAYIAYKAYCDLIGEQAVKPENSKEVFDFYGTYFSKSKRQDAKSDTITYYDIQAQQVLINDIQQDSMYDEEKFSQRDKYAGFLHGNNGISRIYGEKSDGKKILLLKDSYGNSFAPFLVQNCSELVVIDLRFFNMKMSELLKNEKFDDILIMYNFMNFASDLNIPKLRY